MIIYMAKYGEVILSQFFAHTKIHLSSQKCKTLLTHAVHIHAFDVKIRYYSRTIYSPRITGMSLIPRITGMSLILTRLR